MGGGEVGFLFQDDVDPSRFVPAARRFLRAIRRGASKEEATAAANVPSTVVHEWSRELAFSQALRAARDRPKARVIDPNRILREAQGDSGRLMAPGHERENEILDRLRGY